MLILEEVAAEFAKTGKVTWENDGGADFLIITSEARAAEAEPWVYGVRVSEFDGEVHIWLDDEAAVADDVDTYEIFVTSGSVKADAVQARQKVKRLLTAIG